MPNEQSKAALRRQQDPRFAQRWFVGDGIDIGCGADPLNLDIWPNINSLILYDQAIDTNHNAMTLAGVDSESLDFVHSSHCLEHMEQPYDALAAWLNVLKPGGFLVCTVPDCLLYENHQWPSRHNSDHKWRFAMTIGQAPKDLKRVILMPELLGTAGADCPIEHLSLITTHWNPQLFGTDQTQGPAECAIEFVLQKALPEGQLFQQMTAIGE